LLHDKQIGNSAIREVIAQSNFFVILTLKAGDNSMSALRRYMTNKLVIAQLETL